MEAVQQTVRVPRCVQKVVPVTYTQYCPRVVCMRVPVADPCAPVCCGETIGAVISAPAAVAVPVPAVAPPASAAPAPGSGTFEPTPAQPKPAAPTPAAPQGEATQRPSLGPTEKVGPVDDLQNDQQQQPQQAPADKET
jgi:hypothetical protein